MVLTPSSLRAPQLAGLVAAAALLLAHGPARAQSSLDQQLTVTCTEGGTFDLETQRELMLHSLAVVNDARAEGMGPWSFGTLMARLAPPGYPGGAPQYVRDWLAQWETNQTVNGERVPRVLNIEDKIITPWSKDAGGALRLAAAPFRLLAIVNRVDRYNVTGAQRDAGELRFVFGAIEPGNSPGAPSKYPDRKLPLDFTIILEFKVRKVNGAPVSGLADVATWARKWAALWNPSSPPPVATYLARLEALTESITAGGEAIANFASLRTNEVSLDDPWDLRHFERSGPDGGLRVAKLKMTPVLYRNGSPELTSWLNAADPEEIRLGKFTLPDMHQGKTMAGPFAPMPIVRAKVGEPEKDFHWRWDEGKAKTEASCELRHHFSLNTCNGCHSGETRTRAVHIRNRRANEQAVLSSFMTGEGAPVLDPWCSGIPGGLRITRRMDELAKRARAAEFLLCGLDAPDALRDFTH